MQQMRRLWYGVTILLALMPTLAGAEAIGVSITAPADSGEDGDACAIAAPRVLSPSPVRWFDGERAESLVGQVTVENERHEIVALLSLDGGEVAGDDPVCTVKATIDLPDAAYYTVYLDGQRITTVAATDASADRVLVVTLDE